MTDLQALDLSYNNIREIKGLDNLVNLKYLNLWDNDITELKGLERLENLQYISLRQNPISSWVIQQFGGKFYDNPLALVKYCRKKRLEAEIMEEMMKEEKKRLEKEAVEKIKKIVKVSDRVKLEMMRKTLKLDEDTFNDKIFDWAAEFNFRIAGDELIINQATIKDFINALDEQFELWEEREKGKIN